MSTEGSAVVKYSGLTPEEKENFREIVKRISSRFIVNESPEILSDIMQVMFLIEKSHWHYTDFFLDDEKRAPIPRLPTISFRKYASVTLELFPHLKPDGADGGATVGSMVDQFNEYKTTVPTYGGVVYDSTKTLVAMIIPFWVKADLYSFPKGKAAKDETPFRTALRETAEETGLDPTPYYHRKPGMFYKGTNVGNNVSTQFFLLGPETVADYDPCDFGRSPPPWPYVPTCRKEVRKVDWVRVSDIVAPTPRVLVSKAARTTVRFFVSKGILAMPEGFQASAAETSAAGLAGGGNTGTAEVRTTTPPVPIAIARGGSRAGGGADMRPFSRCLREAVVRWTPFNLNIRPVAPGGGIFSTMRNIHARN